jgi:hypothetical protein
MFCKQKLKKPNFSLIFKALMLNAAQMYAWQQQKNGISYGKSHGFLTHKVMGFAYA